MTKRAMQTFRGPRTDVPDDTPPPLLTGINQQFDEMK